MDFWDDDETFVEFPEYHLDLTDLQTCKVKSITRFVNKNVICLESIKTGEQTVCHVEGFWLNINLDIGEIVNATANKVDDQWIINNDHGLLIYQPDLLISTTSVVGSVWCKRKNLLTELFRGFEPANEVMVIGILIHVILQTCLRQNLCELTDIVAVVDKELSTSNTVRRLYESGLTKQHAQEKILQFIPNIQKFLRNYLHKNQACDLKELKEDNWKGVIKSIDDIEENFWCPELGLKGKVDVTVKTDFQTLPLEVKTGRASFSLEHKGQIILYIMMMQKLGYSVSSGLLLYIRENILKEVPATKKEMRDLLILRNDLCYYLTRKSKIGDENSLTVKLYPPELPPPINHPACQKCPYKYICCSYAKYTQENISSNRVLKETQDEMSNEITDSHLNYIMTWISLLDLESNSNINSKELREIYTQTPEQRESKGRCITNLKVISVGDDDNGMYEHHFGKLSESNNILYSNGILEGNYVLISTNKRTAVAAGFVTGLTTKTISIFLERNLNSKYAKQAFHIDSYDSMSFKTFNMTSLSILLELSPKAEKLRKIIIDKCKPTFRNTLPKIIGKLGRSILTSLNIYQQRAVLKALAAKDYFLIKGMPGTGKTATLAALIILLHELGKNILITSHTHNAVDHLCLKLVDSGIKFMRLGSESRINPALKEYSEYQLTKHCQSPEELADIYNNVRIFAVTCLGSGHPVLTKRSLDICIIDESTQVLQSAVIRPIYSADTFILIGDPEQLPAVVKNKQARELGMSESLFQRLYREENSAVMKLNYRMNARITALANEITYNGELLIGSSAVSEATIKLPSKQSSNTLGIGLSWIEEALSESIENSIQFIDTGPVWNLQHDVDWRVNRKIDQPEVDDEHNSGLNVYEAAVVKKLIDILLESGVKSGDIGVIATYRTQVAQISSIISADVDVNTVDQFQGKDKSIVIFSCSKSKDTTTQKGISKHEILEDKRRITVAITRAKHKLILIGDLATVKEYSTFKKLISFLENNIIRLKECAGFTWDFIHDI